MTCLVCLDAFGLVCLMCCDRVGVCCFACVVAPWLLIGLLWLFCFVSFDVFCCCVLCFFLRALFMIVLSWCRWFCFVCVACFLLLVLLVLRSLMCFICVFVLVVLDVICLVVRLFVFSFVWFVFLLCLIGCLS